MKENILSCFWFNGNADEAADYYIKVFRHGIKINRGLPIIRLSCFGSELLLLNGGPKFSPNPALSNFLYCGDYAEAARIFQELAADGVVMIPFGKQDWATAYGWVKDKFGISWQIDGDDIRVAAKICPALLFVNEQQMLVREARDFYLQVFKNSKLLIEMPFPEGLKDKNELVFSQIKLFNSVLNIMAGIGEHSFSFTPGNSLVIFCDTQDEIDYFWEKLGEGGRYDMCGWLADKYGVSWQIVPTQLEQWISDPEHGKQKLNAMLNMQKLIVSDLIIPQE